MRTEPMVPSVPSAWLKMQHALERQSSWTFVMIGITVLWFAGSLAVFAGTGVFDLT